MRNGPIKRAEAIAGYVLGIERQHTALKEHAEWVAAYEAKPGRWGCGQTQAKASHELTLAAG